MNCDIIDSKSPGIEGCRALPARASAPKPALRGCLSATCILSMAASLLVAACGPGGKSWHTETAGPGFSNGTRVLGEVTTIAPRQAVLEGRGLFRGWKEKMLSAGYADGDITDGSEISVFTYCYAHNSKLQPCQHHGHYLAHVPPGLRGNLRGVDPKNSSSVGDLVEVALVRTGDGDLVGKVVRVVRPSGKWSPFRMANLESSGTSTVLTTLAGYGPPQARWIDCEGAPPAGWTRVPVSGAPLTGGPPVSQWFK